MIHNVSLYKLVKKDVLKYKQQLAKKTLLCCHAISKLPFNICCDDTMTCQKNKATLLFVEELSHSTMCGLIFCGTSFSYLSRLPYHERRQKPFYKSVLPKGLSKFIHISHTIVYRLYMALTYPFACRESQKTDISPNTRDNQFVLCLPSYKTCLWHEYNKSPR